MCHLHCSDESSNADSKIGTVHSKDASYNDRKGNIVCRTHLLLVSDNINEHYFARHTFPVRVMTTLQMAKPKNTIGIVSRAVKPSDMTVDTVLANGGASISEHQ